MSSSAPGAGMKVCIFGAGAIGGHLAARFARGGADVSVIARGAHLAAMQAHGLRIEEADDSFTVAVTATDDPATLGPQDVVLVTTKAPALPSVAAAIAPLLGPDTPVVFVMNGIPWWYLDGSTGALEGVTIPSLDPGGALHAAIDPRRVMGATIYSSCTVASPGVVLNESTRNLLVFGELDGTISARAEAIAAPLIQGGFTVQITPDIRSAVWSKLLHNLAGGPIGVLTTQPGKFNLQEPAIEKAIRAIYQEGVAIAEALGCTTQIDTEGSIALSRASTHKTSILQDLELGRPMEVATIFDAPLQLARLVGVETPVLDLMMALARTRAKAAGLC